MIQKSSDSNHGSEMNCGHTRTAGHCAGAGVVHDFFTCSISMSAVIHLSRRPWLQEFPPVFYSHQSPDDSSWISSSNAFEDLYLICQIAESNGHSLNSTRVIPSGGSPSPFGQ